MENLNKYNSTTNLAKELNINNDKLFDWLLDENYIADRSILTSKGKSELKGIYVTRKDTTGSWIVWPPSIKKNKNFLLFINNYKNEKDETINNIVSKDKITIEELITYLKANNFKLKKPRTGYGLIINNINDEDVKKMKPIVNRAESFYLKHTSGEERAYLGLKGVRKVLGCYELGTYLMKNKIYFKYKEGDFEGNESIYIYGKYAKEIDDLNLDFTTKESKFKDKWYTFVNQRKYSHEHNDYTNDYFEDDYIDRDDIAGDPDLEEWWDDKYGRQI